MAAYATQGEFPAALIGHFNGPNADPTPPFQDKTPQLLDDARATTDWTSTANDTLLSSTHHDSPTSRHGNIGTALMRAVLHTWFHAGEINSVRQILGHPEIPFVGSII